MIKTRRFPMKLTLCLSMSLSFVFLPPSSFLSFFRYELREYRSQTSRKLVLALGAEAMRQKTVDEHPGQPKIKHTTGDGGRRESVCERKSGFSK